MTVQSLSQDIQTEADAYAFIEALRWPDGVACPTCQGSDCYLIAPKNGTSRKATNGTLSQRRVWNCRACRREGRSPQFSATSGTSLHGTRVPLRVWCLVLLDMIAAKNGISAREVERKYGVCPRTAWFVCHRIREAMRWDWVERWENATVVADEAYIGGDPGNLHEWQRQNIKDGRGTDKTPVVSILNNATGEVRSHVVANVTGYQLGQILMGNVDPMGSVLVTDKWKGYNHVGTFFAKHERVDHSAGEYVRDGYTTNRLESFFSQLKRSIDGTHHSVSREHLHRYVAEHDFRRSTCKMTDAQRLAQLLSQIDGRRITYKAAKG